MYWVMHLCLRRKMAYWGEQGTEILRSRVSSTYLLGKAIQLREGFVRMLGK